MKGDSVGCGMSAPKPDGRNEHQNITLRDHYAAMAPDMPGWYRPTLHSPVPGIPDPSTELSKEHRTEYVRAREERWREEDMSPEVLALSKRIEAANRELRDWNIRQQEHAYFAWRWHYADMMLRARGAA